MQALAFTLDEIADLIKLDDGTRCTQARDIAAHKLTVVRARLRDLENIEKTLTGLVRQCETRRGTIRCPLIDNLTKQRKRAISC